MSVTPPGPGVSCEADDKVPVDPGIKNRKERHQVDGMVKLNVLGKTRTNKKHCYCSQISGTGQEVIAFAESGSCLRT